MSLSSIRPRAQRAAIVLAVLALFVYRLAGHVHAQAGPRTTATPQKLDDDYTARIKKATPDARILTELVDHMPASATVPSPLKFLGYVPGEPGHMTYHADIVRYYEALEKASPRVQAVPGRQERGRARHGRARHRRRSDDQAARQVQADHRAADRSAEAAGGGSEDS